MPELKEVFEMVSQKVEPDVDAWKQQDERHRRRARNRRIGAFAVAAAVVAAAIVFAVATRPEGEGRTVGNDPSEMPVIGSDSKLDLLTGRVEPLPDGISGSDGEAHAYALSPDGARLAFGKASDDGTMQIFVAAIDGTDVTQVTSDPVGADFPAWTPDGQAIAFEGYGAGDVRNIFLIDLQSGETRQVTYSRTDVFGTQVSPDGSSVVYGGERFGFRKKPIAGGRPSLLAGGGGGLGDAGGGSISPDGRRIAFPFGRMGERGTLWIANADGSDRRQLVDAFLECSRSGSWSPDSSTLVCTNARDILLIDAETGNVTTVADAGSELGETPIWLDDHTLIVDV